MISIEYNTRKESGKPSTYARLGDVPDGGGLHNVPDQTSGSPAKENKL